MSTEQCQETYFYSKELTEQFYDSIDVNEKLGKYLKNNKVGALNGSRTINKLSQLVTEIRI